MGEKELLEHYLPEQAVETVYNWIVEKNIHLRISKKRKTKLGDYRPPIRHLNHRISVNNDLNTYAFLITFIHEYAHLLVWEKHKNKVDPHGQQWKDEYRDAILNFTGRNIFPDDIEKVLLKSIIKSKASSTSDLKLSRILKKYDDDSDTQTLEDLNDNAIFFIEGGRRFQKGEKRRTRYKCKNLDNNKIYLVHALTPVIEFDQE